MAAKPWAAGSLAAVAALVLVGGTLIPRRARQQVPAPEIRIRQGGAMHTIARNWQDIATLGAVLAIAGVLLGLAVIVYMTFSPAWTGSLARFRTPFHSFLIVVMGTLAILLVGLILSRFRPAR
jgi:hypothetical protein